MDHDWVDRALYPFPPRFAETPWGRMHYVDEGEGPPVLMVHGTPTWSFLFRDVILELARDHRVIAPDHLGFGLSDKPPGAPYEPRDHARRLASLIEHLELEGVTLVVHDFGGPIGLSWALERPEKLRALVLMNTWLWSLEGTRAAQASRLFATPVGRLLYTRLNFSPRVLVRAGFADRKKLTRRIHRHYLRPFRRAAERQGPWAFAKALASGGPWYDRLWARRDRLAGAPTLLLWGRKDGFFGPEFLSRWQEALPAARIVEFAEAGHFVPEEVEGPVLADAIRRLAVGATA